MSELDNASKDSRSLAEYVLIFGCALLLGAALIFVLWRAEGALTINALLLFGLFVIVCLSTGFDNFQLGRLLSISREKRAAEKDALETKAINQKLLTQLVQFSSSLNTNQHVQQTFQIGTPKVEPASEIEKEAAMADIQEASPVVEAASISSSEPASPTSSDSEFRSFEQRRETIAAVEKYVIQDYLRTRAARASITLKEVKITGLMEAPDPISTREIIFDAYVKEDGREYFVEALSSNYITPLRFDRIYVQIARVFFYKLAKSVDAQLVLLVVDFPALQSATSFSRRYVGQITERYRPAILSGLLKIEWITFNDAQIAAIMSEASNGIENAAPIQGGLAF